MIWIGRCAGDKRCSTKATWPRATRGCSRSPNNSCTRTASEAPSSPYSIGRRDPEWLSGERGEQDGDLPVGEKVADPLGERLRPRREIVVLGVEVVQELADDLSIGAVCLADDVDAHACRLSGSPGKRCHPANAASVTARSISSIKASGIRAKRPSSWPGRAVFTNA